MLRHQTASSTERNRTMSWLPYIVSLALVAALPPASAHSEPAVAMLRTTAHMPVTGGATATGGLPAARILANGRVLFGHKVAANLRRLPGRGYDVLVYGLASGATQELWPTIPGGRSVRVLAGEGDGMHLTNTQLTIPTPALGQAMPVSMVGGALVADADLGTISVGAALLPDGTDPDGDGVASTRDDCPVIANADQSDRDADGRGDACDLCDGAASFGASAARVMVRDLTGARGTTRWTFTGSAPLSGALDPIASGVHVRLEADGTTLVDVRIPGGRFRKASKDGWRRIRGSDRFRLKNGPAAASKVELWLDDATASLGFRVSGEIAWPGALEVPSAIRATIVATADSCRELVGNPASCRTVDGPAGEDGSPSSDLVCG